MFYLLFSYTIVPKQKGGGGVGRLRINFGSE